eukprot:3813249-Lingulodinium_polyedra.AAC.1
MTGTACSPVEAGRATVGGSGMSLSVTALMVWKPDAGNDYVQRDSAPNQKPGSLEAGLAPGHRGPR